MSDRSVPPIRADHVGSLLRPPELLGARDEASALTADEQRAKLSLIVETAEEIWG